MGGGGDFFQSAYTHPLIGVDYRLLLHLICLLSGKPFTGADTLDAKYHKVYGGSLLNKVDEVQHKNKPEQNLTEINPKWPPGRHFFTFQSFSWKLCMTTRVLFLYKLTDHVTKD